MYNHLAIWLTLGKKSAHTRTALSYLRMCECHFLPFYCNKTLLIWKLCENHYYFHDRVSVLIIDNKRTFLAEFLCNTLLIKPYYALHSTQPPRQHRLGDSLINALGKSDVETIPWCIWLQDQHLQKGQDSQLSTFPNYSRYFVTIFWSG